MSEATRYDGGTMTEHEHDDCKECRARELAAWREGRAAGLREAVAAIEQLPEPEVGGYFHPTPDGTARAIQDMIGDIDAAEHEGRFKVLEPLHIITGRDLVTCEPLTDAVHPPGTVDAARALAEAVARHEAKRKGDPQW